MEQIFKNSLEAMTTKGEWELIDMRAEKPVLLFLEGGWDNLIVYVGAILDLGGGGGGSLMALFHCMVRHGTVQNHNVVPG